MGYYMPLMHTSQDIFFPYLLPSSRSLPLLRYSTRSGRAQRPPTHKQTPAWSDGEGREGRGRIARCLGG